MQKAILFLAISLLFSCHSQERRDAYEVSYKGALKNFMMSGDLSAKAELSAFANSGHFYALGAMEGLKGEIQIFDSQPYNSTVVDSQLIIDNSFEKKASLLVYTTVEQWSDINISDPINSIGALEIFIKRTAEQQGLNINKPFPFLIEGTARLVEWHVIDWTEDSGEMTHENHKKSGLNGMLREEAVEILGFYSEQHKAIFTHHSSNVHMHMKAMNQKIAGHIDQLELKKGMTLKLPSL